MYTYNFDLDRLQLATYDPTASVVLSQAEYNASLVLTLRQYRDALTGRTKGAEVGYLFILHSGIHAIV